MHEIDRVVRLLKGYLKGDVSPDSNEELRKLLNDYPDLLEFVKKLETENGLEEALEQYKLLDNEQVKEEDDNILQGILSQIRIQDRPPVTSRFHLKKSAVAASVAILFFVMFYTFQDRFIRGDEVAVQTAADFVPGTNKAVLTTSDGVELELSSLYEGIVVGDQVLYEDGSVLLDEEAMDQDVVLTLATPRGGQYQVSLPDGTNVWLNADSKLRYPRKFSKANRIVEMEGEAYFEVAKDETKPFIVHTGSEKIEVLGTSFNVNSYREESVSAVALLEGKVKISLPDEQVKILHPGQQSLVKGDVIQIQKIDATESVAWKNGEFMFNNESLGSVMRKLARWYDIEVEIAPDIHDLLIWGSISRYDNFNEVLQVIKMTDDNIQFKVEGRRVKLMK